MDGLCTLYSPKCNFLTPFKWQKKKRTKYFQQYVQDAIMIQAENNNISLMDRGCKHTSNGFPFLLPNYSRTSRYGHFSNRDTSIILWTVSNVQTKFSYIFFKKEPLKYRPSLIRTTDSKSWPRE